MFSTHTSALLFATNNNLYDTPFPHTFSAATPGFTSSRDLEQAPALKRVRTISASAGRAILRRRAAAAAELPLSELKPTVKRAQAIGKEAGRGIAARRGRRAGKENVVQAKVVVREAWWTTR